MKRYFHNKILLAFLFAVLCFSSISVASSAEDELEGFRIETEDQAVQELILMQDQKTQIFAKDIPADSLLQWQIALPGEAGWIDIAGQETESLMLSYALVANVLDASDETAVRCSAVLDDAVVYSDAVKIKVLPKEETLVPEEAAISADDEGWDAFESSSNMMMYAFRNSAEYASEENEVYTITINYSYKEEDADSTSGTVWESYTATIEEGQPLQTRVPNKNIPGYGPYFVDNEYAKLTTDGTGSYIDVDIAAVTSDLTFEVYYKKVPVTYYARYFLQNINNDLYTEATGEYRSFQGYVDEEPDPEDINIDLIGFTSLFHEPDLIAADGSTVFECYYDRNYYLMNFDLGGGYGVDPIYARYQYAMIVSTPTRSGYQFAGWDLVKINGVEVTEGIGVADTLPEEVPAENRTYRALWEKVDTTFTVIYWKADLDDGNASTPVTYSYWGKDSVEAKSATELVPSEVGKLYPAAKAGFNGSKEAGYFTYDSERTAQGNATTVTVEGDGSTIVNVYYNRNVYEIRYIYARRGGYWDTYQVSTSTGDGTVGGGSWKNTDDLPPLSDNRYTGQSEEIGSYTYYYISISAEYGANIEDAWPDAAIGSIGNFKWGSWAAENGTGYRETYGNEHANIVGPYPVMSADMIKDPANPVAQRMTAWWGEGNQGISNHAYHIYYEVLPGQKGEVSYQGREYKLDRTRIFTAAHNGSTRVDPFVYAGFKIANENTSTQGNSNNYHNNTACPDRTDHSYCNIFYYNRNSYTLSFYNYNEQSVAPADQVVKYEESLSSYKPTTDPAYPSDVEPDSLRFVDWYTTPEFIRGTEVDWTATMPEGNVTLYAKWEPVIHTVEFYDTYALMDEGAAPRETRTVEHGSVMSGGEVKAEHPDSSGDYAFVGWFYLQEGQKIAFEPTEMEVRRPLKLYAEWQTQIVTEYSISYVRKDTGEAIADELTGHTFVAITKTFSAKAGQNLNLLSKEEKEQLWLPETNSHSILMQQKKEDNVFTFRYEKKEKAPYTVRYLEEGTNRVLHSEITYADNKSAIVTERFKAYSEKIGKETVYWIPDAFHKQLILSANDDENVITFYYTRNDEGKAPYQITHYIQNVDGEYEIYTIDSGYAKIGSKYTAEALSISGYQYVEIAGETVKSGTIVADGLELHLYYNRNKYPYQVKYINVNTGKEIDLASSDNPVTRPEAHYDSVVTEEAITIPGFNLVGTEKTKKLTISVDVSRNVITFYYEPKPITLNYVPLCTMEGIANFGGVTQSREIETALESIDGSIPLAKSGFEFVGWYTDSECAEADKITDSKWVNSQTNRLDPQIDENDLNQDVYEYTYYALFRPAKQDLTITKTGVDSETDSFLFRITGTDVINNKIDMIVSIQGNGSVTVKDLNCGTYTVQELSNWSWTYQNNDGAQEVTLAVGKNGSVTFRNTWIGSDWLFGEGSKENQFGFIK